MLDDGIDPGLLASNGQRWSCFTDQVMGGRSTATLSRVNVDGRSALCLTGDVRLENRGGFIQMALPLAPAGAWFDASGYDGFSIEARASVGEYFVHLRTLEMMRPWQHYQAPFPVGERWSRLVVPFAAFTPQGLDSPLDRNRLTRIGIVAGKSAFAAEIQLAQLSLHPRGSTPAAI